MKLIIIAGILLACVYFWNNRSDGSISAGECASMGGKLTEHGCETPISKSDCEKLGGTLHGSDCEMKAVKVE